MTLTDIPSQRFKYIFLGILCLLILCTPVMAANLIQNPGFETGNFNSWTTSVDSPATLTIGAITHSGTYAAGAALGSAQPAGKSVTVYQNIDCTIADGTISFWFNKYTSYGSGTPYIDLMVDGTTVHSWDISGYSTDTWYQLSHAYTQSGTHDVKVVMYFSVGRYGLTIFDDFSMSSVVPTAYFTADHTMGVTPLSVTFTATPTGSTDFYWDFGNGATQSGSGTGSGNGVTYSYSASNYSVNYRASNTYASTWYNRTSYIQVNQTPTITSITPSTTSGAAPLTVSFSAVVAGKTPISYNWTFGDGGQNTISATPTYIYTGTGTYAPHLVITTNGDGTAAADSTSISTTSAPTHTGIGLGGTITNSAGGVVSGAVVTLTNKTYPWTATTTTDTLGVYIFNNMSTSTTNAYTVGASKSGFYDSLTANQSFTAGEITNGYKDVSFQMIAITSSSDTTAGVGGRYAPHLVRFTVKMWYGEPVVGDTVTATGMSTSAGNWSWLNSLFSFDFSATPIQNTTMVATTGSDGAVSFWMIENVYYRITSTTGTTIYVYPKNDEYPLTVFGSTVANNYDSQTFSVTSGAYNSTYSWIFGNYTDSSGKTSENHFDIYNGSSPNKERLYSTSALGGAANNFNNSYFFKTHIGDEYIVTFYGKRDGTWLANYTSVVTIPGRILDLKLTNTDYYSWIALALIYLIAQLGGAMRVRDVAVITSIFALFLAWIGWLPTSTLLLQAVIVFAVLYYTRKGEER